MSARKGRGSQVFTQEMACALVDMYYARKREYPGSGYSLPPEGFEAIAQELREKFNVGPNEIDQQTLKKKLSNIRTRVRNRCKDMQKCYELFCNPESDLTSLNLTPSEQMYFRYFGPPTVSENNNRNNDSETVSPVQNGIVDHLQGQDGHVNGVMDGPALYSNTEAADLPDAAGVALMRIYGENLHLFTEHSIQIKNIDQLRLQLFDTLAQTLQRDFKIQWSISQVQDKIDEVARSLGQKIEDYRRLSGQENNNLILRPPNLSPPELELFDAQYQERSPPKEIPTSVANVIHIPVSGSEPQVDYYGIVMPPNGLNPDPSGGQVLFSGPTSTNPPMHVAHEVTIPHQAAKKPAPKRSHKAQKRVHVELDAHLQPEPGKPALSESERLVAEKQRTLHAERVLAEESLVLVRKQVLMLERQNEYYRMPKLSNRQYMGLLTVHEEHLADLSKCKEQPPWFQKQIYDQMVKSVQQKLGLKLTPTSLRSHMGKLRQRVERKVNAAAIKSGSTDEEVLAKSAGFTPVEAKLYRLLTDKENPLALHDNHEDMFKVDAKEAKAPPPSRKRQRKEAKEAESPDGTVDTSPAKPSPIAAEPNPTSEPETNNIDAYMDTIERVAQMGRMAPSYEALEVQIPSPPKKAKKGEAKETEPATKSPKPKKPKKGKNAPVADAITPAITAGLVPEEVELTPASLQRQKQQLYRAQKQLAEQKLLLDARQAEVLQSQARFYDAWAGLAQTVSSFFRLLPLPPQHCPQAI